MRTRTTILLGVALVGAAWLTYGSAVSRAAPSFQEEEESVLAGYMQNVMGTVRALGGTISDPEQNEATLATLAELQETLLKAKLETPTKAAGLEGEALDEFMSGYRRKVIEFLQGTLELEDMILAGDDVEELVAKLKSFQDIKKMGHRAYK